MTDVSESVIQAVQILTDNAISQLKYDKTVQAEIYSVVDLNTGEYKVRYNGNIFSAYSEDTSKTYEEEDQVYVKVPEGDFSNRKIITSLVTADSVSATALTALANSIVDISPTFDVIYANEDWAYDASASYGVIAGVPEGEAGSLATICEAPDEFTADAYHGTFQLYANNYEYIRVKASFQTQFHSTHSKGNYGLDIEFYTQDGDTVTYRFGIENFNGNPYSFSVFSTQQVVLQVTKNYLTGLKSIKLFEEGFDYDTRITGYDTEGNAIYETNTTTANIIVKDILISYVDVVDMSGSNYYLTISAPKGSAFNDKVTSLTLMGKLLYQGEDIIDKSKCTFQWYQRDLSVTTSSDYYVKAAGCGWMIMVGEKSKTLELDISAVRHSQWYKLVCYYGNDVTVTAQIEVMNNQDTHDYSLAQTASGDSIYLQIVNNKDDESLVGDWYFTLPDNSYNSMQLTEKQSRVEISGYLKYTSVTFYVAVYDSEDKYLGVLEHTIVNSENEEDVTLTYEGDDEFRYDANGDVTIEEALQERNLSVSVAWKTGYGTSYTLAWCMKDSNGVDRQLPTQSGEGDEEVTPYDPDNSMMEQLWVDNYNILHYNIRQKYKVNYTNNMITVQITTLTGNVYSFEKEIVFLKDGDQGTNGTTYTCVVRTCDEEGTRLTGFTPLVWNGSWLESGTQFVKCYVYCDGVPLKHGENDYEIQYEWTGHNVLVAGAETVSGEEQVIVRGASSIFADTVDSSLLDFYVKVQVDIKDPTGAETTIYTTYPLDVVIGNLGSNKVDISDIPLYIKYNSSGEEPSYYSNNITFYYNGADYAENISSLNESLIETYTSTDGLVYLRPTSSFKFENVDDLTQSNIGVLNLAVPSSSVRLIHPIVMYLDTYGNEAINGWDGTALEIGKDDNGNQTYLLAPQIGAGKKHDDNTFTGVIMGIDTGQDDEAGLYGYQKGVSTFGFKADGTGYIGAASAGRISFDGKSGTITSGNYVSGTTTTVGQGMQIDMTHGSIDASSWTFDGEKQKYIFKLADSTSSLFRIVAANDDGETQKSSILFNVSGNDSSYYLQSKGFKNPSTSTDGTTIAGTGTKIDLANGTITSYDFNLKTPYLTIRTASTDSDSATTTGGSFIFDASGGGSFTVKGKSSDNSSKVVPIINITGGGASGYIQSADGTFYVSLANGNLRCTGADIEGRMTVSGDSYLAGNVVITGTLSYSNGKDGEDKEVFSVGSGGVTVQGTITATKGSIGGWTITNSTTDPEENPVKAIYAGSTYLYSNGKIVLGQYLKAGDYIKAGTIEITSLGTLGNVTGSDGTKGMGIQADGIMKIDAGSNISITAKGSIFLETSSSGDVEIGVAGTNSSRRVLTTDDLSDYVTSEYFNKTIEAVYEAIDDASSSSSSGS